jgi:hypothetical protein
MLQVGDRLFLPHGSVIRSIRYGITIPGPRAGWVTDTLSTHGQVEVQWHRIPTPLWFSLEDIEQRCRKVMTEAGESVAGRQRAAWETAQRAASISEALARLGFQTDQDRGCFVRGRVAIPFTALAGHTVTSFLH